MRKWVAVLLLMILMVNVTYANEIDTVEKYEAYIKQRQEERDNPSITPQENTTMWRVFLDSTRYQGDKEVTELPNYYPDIDYDLEVIANPGAMKIKNLVIDKKDNIYYYDYKNKAIMKIDNRTHEISELVKIYGNAEFCVTHKQKDGQRTYGSQRFIPGKLIYNPEDDSLYLGGSYPTLNAIFKITPKVKAVAFDTTDSNLYQEDIIKFIDGDIYYTTRRSWYGDPSFLLKAKPGYPAEIVASEYDTHAYKTKDNNFFTLRGQIESYKKGDFLYALDSFTSMIHQFNMKTKERKELVFFNKMLDHVTTHDGKFYGTLGTTIYEIGAFGNAKIRWRDFVIKDSAPQEISAIAFDSNGDMIVQIHTIGEDNWIKESLICRIKIK